MELWLTVNGKRTCASAPLDPLTRAVVISLFTWRRAEPDDNADVPMGWSLFTCKKRWTMTPQQAW